MKRMLVVLPFLVACASEGTFRGPAPAETPAPADSKQWDDKAVAIVDRMVDALGGQAAWAQVGEVVFDLLIEIDGQTKLSRRHMWDRATGRHLLEQEIEKGQRLVIAHRIDGVPQGRAYVMVSGVADRTLTRAAQSGAQSENRKLQQVAREKAPELEKLALQSFKSDVFWLTGLYRLKTLGATLKYHGRKSGPDGKEYEVIEARWSGPGWVPSDAYSLYVDPETHLPAFSEILQSGRPGPVLWAWEDWKQAGPIKISARRRSPSGKEVISFDNVRISPQAVEDKIYQPWMQ